MPFVKKININNLHAEHVVQPILILFTLSINQGLGGVEEQGAHIPRCFND